MTASINQCLAQLESDLTTALVTTYADAVYAYRTFPDRLGREVYLTHQFTNREPSAAGGKSRSYDMVAVAKVQFAEVGDDVQGTAARAAAREAALEGAEQAINDLENAIWDYFEGTGAKNSLWMRVEMYKPSDKPEAPVERPRVRFGRVYFRLYLK